MTDPLAFWFVHEVTVARCTGVDVENTETWASPVPVTGFYQDGETNVRDENGDLVEAAGRFAYPRGVATITLRSKLTLPAAFGGQEVRVVASMVADGPPGTPTHKIVGVK